jgi:hypothetical protein
VKRASRDKTAAMTMRARLGLVATCASAIVLAGCPSKEGEQKDAQAPTASSAATGAPAGAGTGPLAKLETEKATPEPWTIDGQPAPFLYWAGADLRASASCQKGQALACDALRQLRVAAPVEIPRRFLDGRQSPGTKVCQKLGHPILVGKNAMGAEDSFCRFPDGSMVSTGALERYAMRVME